MSRSANRRETLTLRVDSMRAIVDQCLDLDGATLMAGVDENLHSRLSSSRLIPRLAMRRARRLAPRGLFAPAIDARDSMMLAGGAQAIEALTLAVGAHIHWSEIVRMVQRVEIDSLDASLGLPARDIAMRGRAVDLGVAPVGETSDAMDLVERVRREGALSWACWLAVRDPVSARRLRVLTPSAVTDLLPRAMPESADDRARRRSVVECEIDAMMIETQVDDREVA